LNCLDVATPILRSRCLQELGIDPAYLVPLGTHNHAAPIQIVPDNYDYGMWLADRIFNLIKEAIDNEKGPVRLMFGTGQGRFVMATGEHGYLHMVLFGKDPVDYDIQVLKVMMGDDVLALLSNHATHPMQISTSKIGTGHPGYAMDEIEDEMPGTLAMYAAACAGNQFVKRPFVIYGTRKKVKSTGHMLAEKVLEIADGQMTDVTGPIKSRLEVIPLPLDKPMSYEEALEFVKKKDIPTDIGFVPYPDPRRETNWVRSLLMHYENNIPFPKKTTDRVCTDDAFLVRELDEPREFPCIYEEAIVSRIGPMVFTALQGEVCAPICMRVKDEFREKMPLMLFAYMGEHNLYIPTRGIVRRNAYQAQVIQIQYASPVPWSEDVEDVMAEEVIRMIESMLE
jgi:hypothetical protein